jgi:hypothetical protein
LNLPSTSLENIMKSKLLGSAAALALTACTVLASAGPASARPWGWHRGFGWGAGAVAAGVIGGAVAAATSPYWGPGYYDYDPGYPAGYGYGPGYGPGYDSGYTYDYVPSGPVAAPGGGSDIAWCESHYRSYNPAAGTYLGFDGLRHSCP